MRRGFLFWLGINLGATGIAQADANAAIKKSLNVLLQAIRYGKNDVAAQKVAFGEMAERLMTDNWSKLTPNEQKEFVKGVETLIRATSFKKGKEQFAYLDAVLFNNIRVTGDSAHAKTTAVVHRNYKKVEVVMDFELSNRAGTWQVVDMVFGEESAMQGVRQDEIEPLLKEGGTQALMQALRERVSEVGKK